MSAVRFLTRHLSLPQEYQQPLDAKLPPGSRGSLASDVKQPHESDTDSMAEYGDDAAGQYPLLPEMYLHTRMRC